MGERKFVYRVLERKPKEKNPLGRPRRRWKDNIKPLNAEFNPKCHLLALAGAHHFVDISRIRVKTNLQEAGCRVRTELSWLEIGTGGGHL
jgi:hypothetical protein